MLYLPNWMTKWRRTAQEAFQQDNQMFLQLYNDVKAVAEDGTYTFGSFLALHQSESGLSDQEAAWLSGTMYAAGTETTSGVLSWFILAMVAYPTIQRKAQAELDNVVGRSRMPAFSDLPNLPYIQAVVKEALRWQPVSPFGNPHRLLEDDVYDGYFIPAGTVCIPNVWSMNRDPDVYGADAHEFNPERHLNNEFPDTHQDGHHSYGFGSRLCVGKYMANDTLFINIAFILWALKLEPAKRADGERVSPSVDAFVHTGLVMKPAPFDCEFSCRFHGAQNIISQNRESIS
ncbi:hypothetical protein MSAN_01851300 [Mycena sanguinolenta]|uniref:Cytochrome P450 n=1 Tax=Mycena sanguinolenta TaxID=230812 RepID=A0A8H7CSW2_9AGAR|nr:hypothetical protein MSAN_01851300 [Mycena sanguinolenta]